MKILYILKTVSQKLVLTTCSAQLRFLTNNISSFRKKAGMPKLLKFVLYISGQEVNVALPAEGGLSTP